LLEFFQLSSAAAGPITNYSSNMNNTFIIFPFTAVCGQEDFKRALILCMIDPSLGGVLALGDKGTGKTTTARGLGSVMKKMDPEFPFVHLPIGATEDRVLGTLQLDTLIHEKKLVIQKGLLAAAHKGVLYIDEVNLLNDYLMDVLLDSAASGGYHLERDTISRWMESRFCLVGTMNPEEGELRPQLLDRFGLSVTVKTPAVKHLRMEIVQRRLQFDADPRAFYEQYREHEEELAGKIKAAQAQLPSVRLSSAIHEVITDTCIHHKVEGLRADILLMKASRAHAAFQNRTDVTKDDVQQIMHLVIAHRTKQTTPSKHPASSADHQPREEKEEDTKHQLMI
jgi:magnesium chelatase subunit I